MAYLQHQQITQYVEGWACYLPPDPLADLSMANKLIATKVQAHDADVATWRTPYNDWRIKDNMAMGVIKGTLCGQYLTYMLPCMLSKMVWDTILGKLKTQNPTLAAHNTKQLLYSHLYVGGPIEE